MSTDAFFYVFIAKMNNSHNINKVSNMRHKNNLHLPQDDGDPL